MPKFDRLKFFSGFRERLDPTISPEQVDGLMFLLDRMEADPFWKFIPQISYALATIFHETAGSFQPVEEGYYLGSSAKVKAFQKKLRYFPWYGRGYVQLTWERNYKLAKDEIGVDFIKNPNSVMEPENAYRILTLGMHRGWFTGKKLDDYIKGEKKDYVNARKIINGLDRAGLIAGYAREFEAILNESQVSAAVPVVADKSGHPADSASGTSIPPASIEQPPILVSPADTNPPTETKITETIGTQKTEVTTIAGHPPEVPPTQVSQGKWFSRILAGFGGASGLATAIWGWAGNHLDAIGIGLICLTLLILALIFRTAILDAIRMQSAADPGKFNVK